MLGSLIWTYYGSKGKMSESTSSTVAENDNASAVQPPALPAGKTGDAEGSWVADGDGGVRYRGIANGVSFPADQ